MSEKAIPWVRLDASYVCRVCGAAFEPGDQVKPTDQGLQHVRCPEVKAPVAVLEAIEEEALVGEESLEAQAIRAGFSDWAIVTARDGTARMFQALVYRRGQRVGIVFAAWPAAMDGDTSIDGLPIRPGVDRWEMRVRGGLVAAEECFVRTTDAAGQFARRMEDGYCVRSKEKSDA